MVDEDRPSGGITAIFDSQHPAVWRVNCALHVASFGEFKLTPYEQSRNGRC